MDPCFYDASFRRIPCSYPARPRSIRKLSLVAVTSNNVRGIIESLRHPARITWVQDPPQHAKLELLLNEKQAVVFEEVPLNEAIASLSETSGTDIPLHRKEFESAGIRDRSPVTLEMNDQKLHSILGGMLREFRLGWVLRDGVIRVVRASTAESEQTVATFDVRDLCRNADESYALAEALTQQAGGSWNDDSHGGGRIEFARPGIMVVRNSRNVIEKTLALIETYRTAFRQSKRRAASGPDPKEMVTQYFKVSNTVADTLSIELPTMVHPMTWKSDTQPEAKGTIRVLPSTNSL